MIQFDPRQPKGIVWLASYPKSGNTWLRVFLYHLTRIQRGLPREENEISQIERASVAEVGFVGVYEKLIGKPWSQISVLDALRVRSAVQAEIARRFPSIVMVKTHSVRGALNGMQTINHEVTAGAVYLVRDPRDVAVSMASHLSMSQDGAISALNTPNRETTGSQNDVSEVLGSWSQNVASWSTGTDPARLILRYEDLLAQPVRAFTAIALHLRQGAAPGQIKEAVQASAFDNLRRQEDKFGFHLKVEGGGKFFAAGKAGGWREKLTAAQADAIVNAHGEMMRKFGYLD